MPPQQKRLAQITVGVVLFCLVLFIGDSIYEHYHDNSHVTPKLHNVYQDSLAQEWEYLRGTLHMSDDCEVFNFHVDYLPSGTVRELRWEFGVPSSGDKYNVYDVWLPPDEKQYQLAFREEPRNPVGPAIKATEFNGLLTPQLLEQLATQEPVTYYRLQFYPSSYVQSLSLASSDVKEIKNGTITNRVQRNSGYTIDIDTYVHNGTNSWTTTTAARYLLVYPQ